MAKNHVEERLAALEAEVIRLKAAVARLTPEKDWRSVVGLFAGSEFMKEVDEAGRRIRELDRKRAKKKPQSKARLAHS